MDNSTPRRGAPAATPRVTVISRDDCHLCEVAKEVVRAVDADLHVGWTVVDVDADLELRQRYTDKVPVILVDGVPVAFWGIQEAHLRAALTSP